MKKSILFTLIMLLGLAGQGRSAEVYQLEPIVVNVTRTEANVEEVPAAVEVINSGEIEARARSNNFYDVLKNSVGVQTDHGSGMGWASILVRGERPTVLFDGVNINNYVTSSPFNILSADTGAVERIEILKGAQAAIQGSGSMSGAINVVMKKGNPDDPYVKLRLGGGSNETLYGAFTVSGGHEKLAWFVNYAQKTTDNYNTPKGRISYTDSEHRNFYARLDYALTEQQELSLETLHGKSRYRSGGEGYYDTAVDPSNRKIWDNRPETTGIFLKYNGEFERINLSATGGYYKNMLHYIYGDGNYDKASYYSGKNRARTDENSYIGDIKTRIRIIDDDILNLHLNYTHKTTDAESGAVGVMPYKFDSTDHQNSYAAQLETKPIPHLLVLGGVRYDTYSRDNRFNDNASPSVGVSVFPFASTNYNWTTLWASYSEAFNMPAANFLYMPAAFGGNPDLKHETSRGWEVGVKQQVSRWGQFNFSYFETKYRDRIVFDLSAFHLSNIGKTSAKGYEAQLEVYPTEFLILYTSYTKMKRFDDETDDRLYLSPYPDSKWVFGLMAQDLHGLTFSLEGAYFAEFKLDESTNHPNEHKLILDAKVSYDLYDKNGIQVEPYLEVNNITDKAYYSSGDVPGIQPGRSFFGGVNLSYHF